MDIDFLKTRSQESIIADTEIFVGMDTPTNPSDNALWMTPSLTSSFAATPWQYNATQGLWLSQPVLLPIPKITLTTSSNFQYFPIRTYGTDNVRCYIQMYFGLVFNLTSNAHDQTNYWSFTLKGHQSNGTISTFWDSPSNTGYNFSNPSGLPGNLPRHIQFNVDTFIGGRTWSLGVDYVRNGNAQSVEVSSTILFRYARAA